MSSLPLSFCAFDVDVIVVAWQVYAQKEFCVRELEIVVDDFAETGFSDLPVELCLTRTLDPALTLRHAVDAMKEAVNKLKMDPPCSRSGVIRFQVHLDL